MNDACPRTSPMTFRLDVVAAVAQRNAQVFVRVRHVRVTASRPKTARCMASARLW